LLAVVHLEAGDGHYVHVLLSTVNIPSIQAIPIVALTQVANIVGQAKHLPNMLLKYPREQESVVLTVLKA